MRDLYYDQLDTIVDDLVAMASSVRDAVLESTKALLEADPVAAEAVISGDREIDAARVLIEDRAFQLLATQQPVASDLRMLVATLRMVADLERMGDLAGHVAKIARMRMPDVAGEVTHALQVGHHAQRRHQHAQVACDRLLGGQQLEGTVLDQLAGGVDLAVP